MHVGKVHSEYLECGLCEFKADNLENLEMHLFTCEIYECNNCKSREKTLSDVKTHITKRPYKPFSASLAYENG